MLKQKGHKHNLGHFWSSEVHTNGWIWLKRYNFLLLVFYSDLKSKTRWDHCDVTSCWSQQKHDHKCGNNKNYYYYKLLQ